MVPGRCFYSSIPEFLALTPRLGALGGSDFANYHMKRFLQERLAGSLKTGDLAAYVESFDGAKMRLNCEDGADEDLNIVLHGRTANRTLDITIEAADTRRILRMSFEDAITAVKKTVVQVQGLEMDFGVLFCGGTVMDAGFRSICTKEMDNLGGRSSTTEITTSRGKTARRERSSFTYDFLARVDGHWYAPRTLIISSHVAKLPQVISGSSGCSRSCV